MATLSDAGYSATCVEYPEKLVPNIQELAKQHPLFMERLHNGVIVICEATTPETFELETWCEQNGVPSRIATVKPDDVEVEGFYVELLRSLL